MAFQFHHRNSFFNNFVLLLNLLIEGKYWLFLPPFPPAENHLFGLCLCKMLLTDWFASTIAFKMTLKFTILLRNEYLFKEKNVLLKFSYTAKDCILYFYFQHVVLYIKFIKIKNWILYCLYPLKINSAWLADLVLYSGTHLGLTF